MNNVIKLIGLIGGAIVAVIIIVIFVALSLSIGQLVGILLAKTPIINEWLTEGIPISKSQIPGITTWLILAGMLGVSGAGLVGRRGGKNDTK